MNCQSAGSATCCCVERLSWRRKTGLSGLPKALQSRSKMHSSPRRSVSGQIDDCCVKVGHEELDRQPLRSPSVPVVAHLEELVLHQLAAREDPGTGNESGGVSGRGLP